MADEKIDDGGGPAFPVHPGTFSREGMSLRDWFAGQALAGLLASCSETGSATPTDQSLAIWSYSAADALLAERAKPRAEQ